MYLDDETESMDYLREQTKECREFLGGARTVGAYEFTRGRISLVLCLRGFEGLVHAG